MEYIYANAIDRESILDNSSKHLVTAGTVEFLSIAISKSSFVIANAITTRYPELWSLSSNNSTPQIYLYHIERQIESHYTSIGIMKPSTVESILCAGSYEQCQFVLKNILSSRTCPSKTSGLRALKQMTHSEDDGVPQWMRCPLSTDEFNELVYGNISYRDDRQALWDVIGEQVALGHSTSVEHLKIAISQGDADALEQMLSRGWNSNGHLWSYFSPPLRFVQTLSKHDYQFKAMMDTLYRDLPQNEWIGSATHATVYKAYQKQRQLFSDKEIAIRFERCRKTLIEHGARVPLIVTYFSKFWQTLLVWAYIICALTYFIVLPPCLVYLTTDVWDGASTSQKFGFAYLWAALSFSFPFGFLGLGRYIGPKQDIPTVSLSISLISILFLLVNDFLLPITIIRLNWKPFLSCSVVPDDGISSPVCTDYSFLLPLVIAGLELWVAGPFVLLLKTL